MNNKESRAFLKGEMDFTPQRMMRYIRSRARIATDEDIEDILQNALVLVTKHFDPTHPEAKLAPYCLGACNKAIAQNLERYHKVALKKREVKAGAAEVEVESDFELEDENDAEAAKKAAAALAAARARAKAEEERLAALKTRTGEVELDGSVMMVKTLAPGKSFDEVASTTSQYRTTSLDSMFDEDDNRTADDVMGSDNLLGSGSTARDPAARALINDLVERILGELPVGIHRTCFVLKYVEGYKREDLIACLKMDAKSIDTIDKRIVRTLKAFKEKMDQQDSKQQEMH
jgi:DNA-directed RNA polymerase specialized sigma24 family protein